MRPVARPSGEHKNESTPTPAPVERSLSRIQRLSRPGQGRRHARHGERPGRGRAMEEDPAEHIHSLVQRASEVCEQAHRKPADGPERRSAPYRAARGAQPEEDVPQVQPAAHLQADAAGERVGGAGVSRQGEY